MPGPSWLGIGAQRSGTDWISRVLTQHPKVDFGTNGKKEQSLLNQVPDKPALEEQYLSYFPDDGVLRGDWSPVYMPLATLPHVAARVLREDAPLFVLLRDPVDRFASAMRHAKLYGSAKSDYHTRPLVRAHQFGQYASSLEGWAAVFPKERFVILTYEEVRENAQAACETFWAALGVEPHPIDDPYKRVKKASGELATWEWREGMREVLTRHYLPQVLWLRDHWGVDVSRWRSFEGLV